MKALVFADLHATEGDERCFHNRSLSLQQWRVRHFYEELHKIYQAHQCDCLWELGDNTSDRSSIPIPALDVIFEGLARFPVSPFNVKLIGNHEMFLRSTAVHVGKMYQERFQVIETPTAAIWSIPGQRRKDKDLYVLCPFPYEDEQTTAWLEAVLDDNPECRRILLGHFQVSGCQLNSGESKTGIPKTLLKEFDLVLLGHVHKPQALYPHVHYVGSPFQQDKGEAGETKRVGVVDLDTLAVTWVPMTGFPEYRTYTLRQFQELARAESEDRLEVVLTSPDEAERFYAHPLSGRAAPIYQYNAQAQGAETVPVIEDWTRHRQRAIARYIELNPPAQQALAVQPDELLSLAERLADADG